MNVINVKILFECITNNCFHLKFFIDIVTAQSKNMYLILNVYVLEFLIKKKD